MNPDDYRNSPSIPERYKRPDSWPHQFIPTSEKKDGPRGIATKNYCQYCHMIWWSVNPRPTGACPARKDKAEMRRLLG